MQDYDLKSALFRSRVANATCFSFCTAVKSGIAEAGRMYRGQ